MSEVVWATCSMRGGSVCRTWLGADLIRGSGPGPAGGRASTTVVHGAEPVYGGSQRLRKDVRRARTVLSLLRGWQSRAHSDPQTDTPADPGIKCREKDSARAEDQRKIRETQ